ncbi:hypothetical protein BDQ94DRAFT_92394 [Aspergillus welwitschiae]|uniref:Uncharacterized protein n=1 Tax=Aspergillus welwitschiae TaxID=1341132 RepID=A0A3F3QFB8_9EURO|nr:hypothetical protein BDQ94DRAFT_92394 [Aspergillus welwitschiae]RDH37750.1 hypothetical protein BDQ94DRAFT_92394 [Aspergillus welwitschiae]
MGHRPALFIYLSPTMAITKFNEASGVGLGGPGTPDWLLTRGPTTPSAGSDGKAAGRWRKVQRRSPNSPAGKRTRRLPAWRSMPVSCDPLTLAQLRLQESSSSPECPKSTRQTGAADGRPICNCWDAFYKMSAPETRVQRQSSTACLSHATILRPTRRSFESRHHLAGRLPGLCVLWIQPGSDGRSPHAGVVCGDVSPDEHFDHHWGPAALQLHHPG